MTVKKVFEPIVSLLVSAIEANPKIKASDLIEQIKELASAKTARTEGATYKKDASGVVVAIFDYYFKRWMPLVGPKAVEFGAKAKTATGFNTMCKLGVSHWTKQQRIADDANKALLEEVKAGTLAHTDIAARQEQIEAERKSIAPATIVVKSEVEGGPDETVTLGFDTEADLVAYLAENGVTAA